MSDELTGAPRDEIVITRANPATGEVREFVVKVFDKARFLAMIRGEIPEPEWWSYADNDLTPDEQREASLWQAAREEQRG